MKILLTGSSGTIGTRLFEKLQETHEVTGVDKHQNKWHSEINRQTILVDLRRAEEFKQLPSDFDLVIHFAANARVYELVREPSLALDNMLINFNVLEFIRQNTIPRIIFASSRETYGNIMEDKPIVEEAMRIENCESTYAASKLVGEALLHAYEKSYGLDFISIRFSNVYGMYDDSNRVIPSWIKQCLNNEPLTLYGREKSLDFTYIDDSVDAVMKMISKFEKVKGNTFNISYGKEVKLLTVIQEIKKILNPNVKIIFHDSRPGEVWRFEADISKATKLLNYEPKVNIEDGLHQTIAWYKDLYGVR